MMYSLDESETGDAAEIRIPDTVRSPALLTVAASLIATGIMDPLVGQLLYTTSDAFNRWYWLYSAAYWFPNALAGFIVGRITPMKGVRGAFIGAALLQAYYLALSLLAITLMKVRNPESTTGYGGDADIRREGCDCHWALRSWRIFGQSFRVGEELSGLEDEAGVDAAEAEGVGKNGAGAKGRGPSAT